METALTLHGNVVDHMVVISWMLNMCQKYWHSPMRYLLVIAVAVACSIYEEYCKGNFGFNWNMQESKRPCFWYFHLNIRKQMLENYLATIPLQQILLQIYITPKEHMDWNQTKRIHKWWRTQSSSVYETKIEIQFIIPGLCGSTPLLQMHWFFY